MSGHLPAFPVPLNPGQGFQKISDADGVTKRELFAAMAMQGLLANPSVIEREASRQEWLAPGYDEAAIQERAIAHADALIAELAKGGDA